MRTSLAATLAIVLLAAVACGGSGGGGGGASQPAGSIKVTMTEFKFDPSDLQAKAGKVTFYLVNAGSAAHDMVIEQQGGERVAGSELVQAGNTSLFTVDNLPAGSYRIVCTQPGHESAGMKGTLSVT